MHTDEGGSQGRRDQFGGAQSAALSSPPPPARTPADLDEAAGLCQLLSPAVILGQVHQLASQVRLLQGPQLLG